MGFDWYSNYYIDFDPKQFYYPLSNVHVLISSWQFLPLPFWTKLLWCSYTFPTCNSKRVARLPKGALIFSRFMVSWILLSFRMRTCVSTNDIHLNATKSVTCLCRSVLFYVYSVFLFFNNLLLYHWVTKLDCVLTLIYLWWSTDTRLMPFFSYFYLTAVYNFTELFISCFTPLWLIKL